MNENYLDTFILDGVTVKVRDSVSQQAIENLAEVARTGAYSDLTGAPSIPTFSYSGTTLTITTA